VLGEELLHQHLGLFVDREGDVAACPGPGVRAPRVSAQLGLDLLPQRLGELDGERARLRGVHQCLPR
jgi:hypothetical protein